MSTVSETIVELAKARERPATIACKLQIPVTRVYSAITRARRDGIDIPRFNTNGTRSIGPTESRLVIGSSLAAGLKRQADRRGVTVSALAGAVLERVLLDNLFDAVLDGEEVRP